MGVMDTANTSAENIAEALKLLELAATQKKVELKNVLSDKYTNLRTMIMENDSNLKDTIMNAKNKAFDAMAHAKEVSVEKACEMAADVDECVHVNPWPYIAGSAAVGLLLGYILGRNRK